ncbi:hypothetical protein OROGR_019020 [Orobanche gracilis]
MNLKLKIKKLMVEFTSDGEGLRRRSCTESEKVLERWELDGRTKTVTGTPLPWW